MNFHICDKWVGIFIWISMFFGLCAWALYLSSIYDWALAFAIVGSVLIAIFGGIGGGKLNSK